MKYSMALRFFYKKLRQLGKEEILALSDAPVAKFPGLHGRYLLLEYTTPQTRVQYLLFKTLSNLDRLIDRIDNMIGSPITILALKEIDIVYPNDDLLFEYYLKDITCDTHGEFGRMLRLAFEYYCVHNRLLPGFEFCENRQVNRRDDDCSYECPRCSGNNLTASIEIVQAVLDRMISTQRKQQNFSGSPKRPREKITPILATPSDPKKKLYVASGRGDQSSIGIADDGLFYYHSLRTVRIPFSVKKLLKEKIASLNKAKRYNRAESDIDKAIRYIKSTQHLKEIHHGAYQVGSK